MDFNSFNWDLPSPDHAGVDHGKASLSNDIAIIGIGLKLPMADNADQFRSNLRSGMDCVRPLPESRRTDTDAYFRSIGQDPEKIQYGEAAYIEGIDQFDYAFFKLSPKEASLLDPNQRLFLQTAWSAIEDSGYGGKKLAGSRTGVYLGFGSDSEYRRMIAELEPESIPLSMPGNLRPIIASRISYLMDLKGPSLVVDTTCSSSLVAVHLACQALRNGECDLAVAGGIQIHLVPVREFEVGVESSTSRTRTFDDASDGTGTGEGSVALILKPLHQALEDRDSIYAVIKSSAINQDGSSLGITAPNAASQADVLAEAWEKAGIDPATISYLEAHGTGTKLGDPVEMEGIDRAFRKFTDKKQFCAIGALKSNIGHLDNTAGIAGLLKAVLSLRHKELYPTLHVTRPNRHIRFEQSPVYLNTKLSAWEAVEGVRRCGVSSFGISGTNSHIVLEEEPESYPLSGPDSDRPELFVLSALTEAALQRLTSSYYLHLCKNGELSLADLCYTASTGRGHYGCRIAIPVRQLTELKAILASIHRDGFQSMDSGLPYFLNITVQEKEGESARTDRDKTARIKLWEFAESGKLDANTLRELGILYVNGADVDWDFLYRQEPRRRLHLPVYSFEAYRCWLAYPDRAWAAKEACGIGIYHQLKWERLEATNRGRGPREDRNEGACLIFKDAKGIGQLLSMELQRIGTQVVEVERGDCYRRSSEFSYTIRSTPEDMERLCRELEGVRISRILYLPEASEQGGPETLDELEERLSGGVYRLFRFMRAIARVGWAHSYELILLSDYADAVVPGQMTVKPEHAAMNGLGKAIRWEFPAVHIRCMDMEGESDLERVLAELKADSNEYKVAFRSGQRYVERLDSLEMSEAMLQPVKMKSDGVYVITGGLGGIGLKIARHLASQAPSIRLALLNRTPLPPREQWDGILQAKEDHRKLCSTIHAIRELEHSGAMVECLDVDVSDPAQMREAWRTLKLRHGKIQGVVHAAGIGEGNLLEKLTEEQFRSVMASKVRGTWIIDQLLLEDDSPDFLVLFSSAITLVGGLGSGPYAAANSYLDAFASQPSLNGRRTLVMNWPTWDNTGLSEGASLDIQKEMFNICSVQDGLQAFDEALNRDIRQVIVGEWNHESLLFELGDRLPFRTNEKVKIGSSPESAAPKTAEFATAVSSRPVKLKGKSDNTDGSAYGEIEQTIAQAWVNVLGYEELDVHQNFFEIGGDSILIARVYSAIDARYPGRVKLTDLFSLPTIAKLAERIQELEVAAPGSGDADSGTSGAGTAGSGVPAAGTSASGPARIQDIAIIGLSMRMPDADNLEQFWDNLRQGRESIRKYPEARQRDVTGFIRHFTTITDPAIPFSQGGFLEEVDRFDYGFFNLSPKEASLMDPNQRLFLEACWEAIEDAGYGGGKLSGTQTGVYLGYADWPVYGQYISKKLPTLIQAAGVGNTPSIMASRISYLLDLQGPAFLIDTACSSSLVAVHMACMAIKNGECDQAIAGGVKVCLMPVDGVFEIGIESLDRTTRAFDDSSDGTVWGEGTVALLLKPLEKALEDRDPIHAVIRGSAVNQDGRSVGITAPNAPAQEKVIVKAWGEAGIDPRTVTYLEAHGTGTKLGDPIEVDGIQRAFRRYTDRKQFCAISSVKSNIGHLDSASGAAGLVKAIAALKHRKLPPTLHFSKPNRKIAFESSPVYVNDRTREWEAEGGPRRCGVSSFGFSGTNCHIVLEEAPAAGVNASLISDKGIPELLTLSGRSRAALEQLVSRYISFLQETDEALPHICLTSNTGRGHYAIRLSLVAADKEELLQKLAALRENGLDSGHADKSVSYGEHSMASLYRENRPQGELTAAERRELSEAAMEVIGYLSKQNADKQALMELGRLYSRGADVDWDQLYRGEERRRVRVPTYPFQRTRCWLDLAQEGELADTSDLVQVNVREQEMRPEVTLKGRADASYSVLERKIGQLWGHLLGLDELDIYDDFFELGGNSIMAIEMEVELERAQITFHSDQLYAYRCIRQLAEQLGEPGNKGNTVTSPAILAPMEPFNDIFYRNCFYNSLFPVVRHFNGNIHSILLNDLIVYDYTNHRFNIHYWTAEPLETVLGRAGLQVDIRHDSRDILSEVIECLREGKPVIAWIDAYYLSIRKDTYRKRHLDHTLLVFGYSQEEQIFYVIEHDRSENLSYRKQMITVEDFSRACQGFADHFLNGGEHKISYYAFEANGSAAEKPEEQAARYAANWYSNEAKRMESISNLRRFTHGYPDMTGTREALAVHLEELIDFTNEVLNAKQVDSYRLMALFDGNQQLHETLAKLIKDWDVIRKGLVRYLYSGEYVTEVLEAGLIRLNEILRTETELEHQLHNLLGKKLNTIP